MEGDDGIRLLLSKNDDRYQLEMQLEKVTKCMKWCVQKGQKFMVPKLDSSRSSHLQFVEMTVRIKEVN